MLACGLLFFLYPSGFLGLGVVGVVLLVWAGLSLPFLSMDSIKFLMELMVMFVSPDFGGVLLARMIVLLFS